MVDIVTFAKWTPPHGYLEFWQLPACLCRVFLVYIYIKETIYYAYDVYVTIFHTHGWVEFVGVGCKHIKNQFL